MPDVPSSNAEGGAIMDPTIQMVLNQGFAEMAKRSSHAGQRLQDASDNIYYQTGLGYLTEQRVVGSREAKASTMLQPVVGQPVPMGLAGSVGTKTGI